MSQKSLVSGIHNFSRPMMKSIAIKVFLSALLLIFMSHFSLRACNMSNLSCVSVTGTGPYFITLELCVGMGISGTVKGADQNTKTVVFGFYDATPGFSITGHTPGAMVSPAPPQATTPATCTMTGVITGPNTALGTEMNVVYIMPNTAPCAGTSGTSYGCVTSTALCGQAISSCSTYTFTVNQCPDSIRVFAVEGNGVMTSGCYMYSDMVVTPCSSCLGVSAEEGIGGLEASAGLVWDEVGPNPVRDILHAGFFSATNEVLDIHISDMTGRRVAASAFSANYGSNKAQLDLGGLANGQYFLSIQGSEGRISRKLVKL